MTKGDKKKKNTPVEGDFECSYCGRFFRLKWQLSEHTRRHEKKTPFQCHICLKSFVKNNYLIRHVAATHDNKRLCQYECQYCSKPLKTRVGKQFHEDTHGFNTYKCLECTETFTRYVEFSNHKKIHKKDIIVKENGVTYYQCLYCTRPTAFSSLEFKKQHEANVHKTYHASTDADAVRSTGKRTKPKVHKCPVCSDNFYKWKMLRSHMVEFHPKDAKSAFNKKKECEICGKSFSLAFYIIHMRGHKGIKPYACSHCDSTFKSSVELRYHSFKHTDLRPFECLKCHKAFKSKEYLEAHMRTHRERKICCELCDKKFLNRTDMKKHMMRMHFRSENISKCSICHKNILNLDIPFHVKSCHSSDEKLCDLCGITFPNLVKFNIHLKRHNKNYKGIKPTKILQKPKMEIATANTCHCSFQWLTKTDINDHCLREHKKSMYACNHCSQISVTKSQYIEQSLNHALASDDIINECSFCGFTSISSLEMHKHLQAHEYISWKYSWIDEIMHQGFISSIVGRQCSNDVSSKYRSSQFGNVESLVIKDESLCKDDKAYGYFLKINVIKEISWIHNLCTKPDRKSKQSMLIPSLFKVYNCNNYSKIENYLLAKDLLSESLVCTSIKPKHIESADLHSNSLIVLSDSADCAQMIKDETTVDETAVDINREEFVVTDNRSFVPFSTNVLDPLKLELKNSISNSHTVILGNFPANKETGICHTFNTDSDIQSTSFVSELQDTVLHDKDNYLPQSDSLNPDIVNSHQRLVGVHNGRPFVYLDELKKLSTSDLKLLFQYI